MRLAERTGALIGLLALLAAGCAASNPAPPDWQRSIQKAQSSPFGAWVTVEQLSGGSMSGELIAVGRHQLVIGSGGQVVPVRFDANTTVTVSAYAADAGGIAATTAIGGLSTISHGFFLIFSLPIWTLVGVSLSRSASREGFLVADDVAEIRDLQRWARFPQGMPKQKPPPPPPAGARGGAGQACYPNATCDAGLICDAATKRCRAAPVLGSQGGACYANGSCDAGLVCTEGTCARSP